MTKENELNSPHPGGPSHLVNRDEPNRRGGTDSGNQGRDHEGGDEVARKRALEGEHEDLVRGEAPKPAKRYGLAG